MSAATDVQHPAWCRPAECEVFGYRGNHREVVHHAAVFTLPASRPHHVRGNQPVVVVLMRFDETADGGPLVADEPVAVVDLPDTVNALTAAEAARLGAALLRAARQLRAGGVA